MSCELWILSGNVECGIRCWRQEDRLRLRKRGSIRNVCIHAASRPGCYLVGVVGRGAGAPCSMPSTLISSSMSGQRTPSPSPRISQCCRCSRVASAKRHDQTNGTLIVRPSIKCVMISSSVTSMVMTRGSTILATVLMRILSCRSPRVSSKKVSVTLGIRRGGDRW
jgi:hypothetical protein